MERIVTHSTLSVSRLELSIECSRLAEAEQLNPAVKVYARYASGESYKLVGATETVVNNLSPTFVKAVCVDYVFNEVQWIRLEVVDNKTRAAAPPSSAAIIGTLECRLSDIMASSGCSLLAPLTSRSRRGSIRISAEECADVRGALLLRLAGYKLPHRLFSSCNPYYTVDRLCESGRSVLVAKSATERKNSSPSWPALKVSVQRLCNGDMERPLMVTVWDDEGKKSTELGYASISARTLLTRGATIHLSSPRASKSAKPTGASLSVLTAQVGAEPSFVDYLRGGCEIALSVAVDFTSSNGPPSSPYSLHFSSSEAPSAYEAAISAVAAILAPYDTDGLIPAYGYGGKSKSGRGVVSHCFALNGKDNAPACKGVEGILEAYHSALEAVALSGPTCFAPCILKACTAASASMIADRCRYNILLILTDGAIHDTEATIAAVIRASALPLSIVIVGVGKSDDFDAMRMLDADDAPLRLGDSVAVRDCVQFVRMADYKGTQAMERLAAAVLAEVPAQLLEHFLARGISPPTPPRRVRPSASSRSAPPSASSSPMSTSSPVSTTSPMADMPMTPPARLNLKSSSFAGHRTVEPGLFMLERGRSSVGRR